MAGSLYPFNFFAFTNTSGYVANAGNSSDTMKAGQLLLLDRNMKAITSSTPSGDLHTLYVAYALVDAQPIISAPIDVRTITFPISVTKYKPFQPQVYTLTAAQLLAKADTKDTTFATLRINRLDSYTTSMANGAGLTQITYENNLDSAKAAILQFAKQMNDRVNGSQNQTDQGTFTIAAAADGTSLTITSVAPQLVEVGSLMTPTIDAYIVFDHTRDGIRIENTQKLEIGAGTGQQIAELEQASDVYKQRNRYIADSPQGFNYHVNKAGMYNTIGLTWLPRFQADMGDINQRALSVSAVFATDGGAVGQQQQDFMAALNLAIPKAVNLNDADTTDLIEDDATAGNVGNSGGGAFLIGNGGGGNNVSQSV